MASPEPADLVALRPDIAAMRADMPQPAETAVGMQADAHRQTDQRPYFEYAGQRFHLKHTPDALDLADLAEYMDQAVQSPVFALGGINRAFRNWFADFDGWRATFREHNAGKTVEEQMQEYGAVATQLFEVTAARPTEAPADSSPGRTPTSTSSKDASLSPDGSPSTDRSASPPSTPG
jgi:hypothetical protein